MARRLRRLLVDDSGDQYLVVRVFPLASVLVLDVAFQPGPMMVRERPLPVAL